MGDKTSHRRRHKRMQDKIRRDPMAAALEDPGFRQRRRPGKKNRRDGFGNPVNHVPEDDYRDDYDLS